MFSLPFVLLLLNWAHVVIGGCSCNKRAWGHSFFVFPLSLSLPLVLLGNLINWHLKCVRASRPARFFTHVLSTCSLSLKNREENNYDL